MRRKRASLLAIFPALIAVFIAIWLQRTTPPTPAAPSSTPVGVPAESTPQRAPEATPVPSGEQKPAEEPAERNRLDQVPQNERAELERTLTLIDRGGPFPYDKDGTVFSNREGLLPRQPRGYYREYTVKTPGASTRGARRVVRGSNGETYYTRDHYDSFIRLDE